MATRVIFLAIPLDTRRLVSVMTKESQFQAHESSHGSRVSLTRGQELVYMHGLSKNYLLSGTL